MEQTQQQQPHQSQLEQPKTSFKEKLYKALAIAGAFLLSIITLGFYFYIKNNDSSKISITNLKFKNWRAKGKHETIKDPLSDEQINKEIKKLEDAIISTNHANNNKSK